MDEFLIQETVNCIVEYISSKNANLNSTKEQILIPIAQEKVRLAFIKYILGTHEVDNLRNEIYKEALWKTRDK